MSSALVSVVIPAYNAAAHLRATLESVLAQSHSALEVIVVDDGSTDDTFEILTEFGSKVRVLRQPNAGQAAARNHGARKAAGEFLAFLDSDDLWDGDKIERQVDLLERHPEALAVYCDHRAIDVSGAVIGESGALRHLRPSGNVLQALLLGSCIVTPGLVLMRRSAFESSGDFDEHPSMRGHEDYALWLRLAARGPVVYSPQTLVSYRRHSQQATTQADYECRMAVAHLRALLAIRADVMASAPPRVRKLYQWVLNEARLEASWAARCLGDLSAARRVALTALANSPTSPRVWRTLLGALRPQFAS